MSSIASPTLPASARPHVVIATWFYDEQPGFLDFKYRIRALSELYDVTLVLRAPHFAAEFADLDLRICILARPRTGKQALLSFCAELAWRVRRDPPALLMLLGAQLATCLLLLPRSFPTLLYWNEHPSHFFGSVRPRGAKAWLAQRLVDMSFVAARRATRVLPIGETLAADLIARGVSQANVELNYMGVDSRFEGICPGSPVQTNLRVVYTGSVSVDRGRDVLIEGLALALQRGVPCQLTLVGAAPDQLAYCSSRAQELGIQAALRLYGRVPGEEIPAFLAQADLGVCLWADKPWWHFNPPTKLFEYLVAGLPVLASNIVTHTRYVTEGSNGLVFDYSPEGFAQCLAAAWQRREEIPGWASQARLGAQAFRWERLQPRFLGLAAHVIGGVPR